MRSITVNPNYLRGLCQIAAKNDVRYYLVGVLIDIRPRETRYVATNGHQLAVIRSAVADNEPDQAPAEIIIPRDVCLKAMQHGHLMAQFIYPESMAPVAGDLPECRIDGLKDGAIVFRPVDGKFPDYSRVIPQKVSCKPGCYYWDYLAAFDAMARTAFDARYAVSLHQNGANDVALVTSAACAGFLGALMPLRGDNPAESPQLPEWWTGTAVSEPTRKRKAA